MDLQVIDSGRGVAIEDSHLPSTLPGVTTTDIISDAPAGGGGGGDAVEEQVPDYACHIRRTKGSETWISSCKSSLSFLLYRAFSPGTLALEIQNPTWLAVFVVMRLTDCENNRLRWS